MDQDPDPACFLIADPAPDLDLDPFPKFNNLFRFYSFTGDMGAIENGRKIISNSPIICDDKSHNGSAEEHGIASSIQYIKLSTILLRIDISRSRVLMTKN